MSKHPLENNWHHNLWKDKYINDKDKRKVILIDNALYDIVENLKDLHGFSEFVKTTLVGKNSSYENSLYNMNDYNESNEHYLDLEMSEY